MNSENLLEPLGKFQQNLAKNGIPDKTHSILVIRLAYILYFHHTCIYSVFLSLRMYMMVEINLHIVKDVLCLLQLT